MTTGETVGVVVGVAALAVGVFVAVRMWKRGDLEAPPVQQAQLAPTQTVTNRPPQQIEGPMPDFAKVAGDVTAGINAGIGAVKNIADLFNSFSVGF